MSKTNSASSASATAATETTPPRRHWFYTAATFVIGGLVGLLPFGIGLSTFLDPLRRRTKVPASRGNVGKTGVPAGFIRVASLGALQPGGMPQRFPVIADQVDGWNFSPNQPVGAVFLQRTDDKTVRCFNATCPHAGCSVSCNGQTYICPCHNSSFQLDGIRRPPESGRENPSPRDLDDLEVEPNMLAKGEVWVRFQNFYTGKHTKIPKA